MIKERAFLSLTGDPHALDKFIKEKRRDVHIQTGNNINLFQPLSIFILKNLIKFRYKISHTRYSKGVALERGNYRRLKLTHPT